MYKTVQQTVNITDENVLRFMDTFKYMVNNCIRIGLKNKRGKKYPSMKILSTLCYKDLSLKYNIHSHYICEVFTKVAGILKNLEHSEKRKIRTKIPYLNSGYLTLYRSFKIKDNILEIPIGNRKFFSIALNQYVLKTIKRMKIHSFILSHDKLSIAYSNPNEIKSVRIKDFVGIDRNLDSLAVGNKKGVLKISLKKPKQIVENTRKIVKSIKRPDKKIQNKVKRKYGKRQRNRVNQYLHNISKFVVESAKKDKQAIVFEDITFVRDKHTKEKNKMKTTRFHLNSLSFAEIKRQIEYKAAWAGVQIIQLSKSQTMYTSQKCHKCGELTQYDQKTRMTFCKKCSIRLDRDILAAINIAEMGRNVSTVQKELQMKQYNYTLLRRCN